MAGPKGDDQGLRARTGESAFLSMVLQTFLWAPLEEMYKVHDAVRNSAHWAHLFASASNWIVQDVRFSPGYKRLDPASVATVEDVQRCNETWDELLTVLISALSCTSGGPKIRALKEQLRPGTAANAQRENENAVEYLARSFKSFHTACAGLKAVGQGALVPHVDDVLVDIVAQGSRRKIMIEFERLFVGDGFTEADMTWTRFQLYFIKAGHLADTKLPRTKVAARQTDDTKSDDDGDDDDDDDVYAQAFDETS